ncbi:MAG: DUF4430 domain-containing protein, partial [Nitrososphaerota archaeon]|nr:DUF4430 domain-containing protein [Nitrososphaerota archaeon]
MKNKFPKFFFFFLLTFVLWFSFLSAIPVHAASGTVTFQYTGEFTDDAAVLFEEFDESNWCFGTYASSRAAVITATGHGNEVPGAALANLANGFSLIGWKIIGDSSDPWETTGSYDSVSYSIWVGPMMDPNDPNRIYNMNGLLGGAFFYGFGNLIVEPIIIRDEISYLVTAHGVFDGSALAQKIDGMTYLLTATPNIGYVFDYWAYASDSTYGEFVRDTENTAATVMVTITEDTTYCAHFRPTAITKYESQAYLGAFEVPNYLPDWYLNKEYHLYSFTLVSGNWVDVYLSMWNNMRPAYVDDRVQLILPIIAVESTLKAETAFSYELYFDSDRAPVYVDTTTLYYVYEAGFLFMSFHIPQMPDISSVTLKVTAEDAGGTLVVIEQTYDVAPLKLEISDPITVYMSVEKLTVHDALDEGGYYIVEPQAFTINGSWSAARALGELLKSHNLKFTNTGSLGSGFYLKGVWNNEANGGVGGYLSEFGHGMYSGWMYSVNHYFPGVGASEQSLSEGDVIRWQYTCEGLGEDLGGTYGTTATTADKTLLIAKYAQLKNSGSTDVALVANLNFALSVLQTLDPSPVLVNAAYALLTAGGTVEANKGQLSNAINEATAFKNAVTGTMIGDDKGWYPHFSYDAFVLAIDAANAVKSDAGATQSTVDNAVTTLKAAVAVFAESKNYLISSDFNYLLDLVLAKVGETTNPSVASVGGEWAVIALARGGSMTDGIRNTYLTNLNAELAGKPTGPVRLDDRKPTENQRVILALTALGLDAANYNGYDFVAPLSDVLWVKSQGINSVTFALIALDSKPYVVDEGVREALVFELSDSDFSRLAVDYTAMALQALAPYYDTDGNVKVVVDNALMWLLAEQNEVGDFGSFSTQNSESTVQVLVALSTLNSDVLSKVSVLDGLLRYALSDGGFQHTLFSGGDVMATEQGAYALVAYERFLNGQNSLYDMSDAFGDVIDPGLEDDGAIAVAKVIVEGAFAGVVVAQADVDNDEVVVLANVNAVLNGLSLNG